MKVSALTQGLDNFQDWEVVTTGEHNRMVIRKGAVELERNGSGGWWAAVCTDDRCITQLYSTSRMSNASMGTPEGALAKLAELINDAAYSLAQVMHEAPEVKP